MKIVQFPTQSTQDGVWLFDLRIERLPSGRLMASLLDVRAEEFTTSETVSQRLHRLGLQALEGAAHIVSAADAMALDEI